MFENYWHQLCKWYVSLIFTTHLRYICFTVCKGIPMESIFWFFKKSLRRFSGYRFKGLQLFFSIKYPLQFFSSQTQTACYNGWLQQVLWKKHSVLDMDHFKGSREIMTLSQKKWKWCHHITDFFQDMHAWNQGYIKIMISRCYNSCSAKTKQIWKNAWLQLLFYDKNGPISVWMAPMWLRISFEKRDDCKCLFQRNTVP